MSCSRLQLAVAGAIGKAPTLKVIVAPGRRGRQHRLGESLAAGAHEFYPSIPRAIERLPGCDAASRPGSLSRPMLGGSYHVIEADNLRLSSRTALEARLTNKSSSWQDEAEDFRRQTRYIATVDAAE